MKGQDIKKTINKIAQPDAWNWWESTKFTLFLYCMIHRSQENWICKNELIILLNSEGKTKPNTTEFLFLCYKR